MFHSKLKSFCCIFKSAYLALVIGLVALPYFQYADGHIHVIAGEVIIHWHYLPDSSNGDDNNTANTNHRHSAAELTIISSMSGLHAYIAELTTDLTPQVYSVDYFEKSESQVGNDLPEVTSARSPPASI